MLRQKCPTSLRVGTILYSALFMVDDSGKATATVYEEVVRSIRRRPKSAPDSAPYVKTVTRIDGLTWLVKAPLPKRGCSAQKGAFIPCWASYIPEMCQHYFSASGDLPPGIHTTRLMAIKSALRDMTEDVAWYEKELSGSGDEGMPDSNHRAELEKEKNELERCIRLAKATLTKERNKKTK